MGLRGSYVLLQVIMTASVVILKSTSSSHAQSLTVTPCKVQNMFVQPHYGVSAKTQDLIEVIQAPPHLTQTVQVGICINGNGSFGDSSLLNSIPNYICRQRYTSVEVFSKVNREKLNNLRSLRNILKVSQDNKKIPVDSTGLVKDLLLIEAGCDIFFNYLSYPAGAPRESFPLTPSMIGVSEINSINSQPVPYNQRLSNQDIPLPTDLKQSAIKQRSLVKNNNFFRKGFHLRAILEADEEKQKMDTEGPAVTSNRTQEGNRQIIQNRTANQESSRLTVTEEFEEVFKRVEGKDTATDTAAAAVTNSTESNNQTSTSISNQENGVNHEQDTIPQLSMISNKTEENHFANSSHINIIHSEGMKNSSILEQDEYYDEDGIMQEHPLNPEDVGLPVIFLDSSLDPIMRLISNIEIS